jgi:uncharacterized protein
MRFLAVSLAALGALALAGCGDRPYDPRGVDHGETLLSVSATGEAETRPDEARLQAGINTWAPSARAASTANAEKIREIVAALRTVGVAEDDIQTRAVSVQRIDYGERRGQYQAGNIVAVTVRDVDRTGDVVAAVTEAGANIVSGPDFRMADAETAANSAYGEAYKAARARAAAQGGRYLPGAVTPVAPPPPPVNAYPVMEQSTARDGTIMAGQTTSAVAVQVDFALVPK